MKKKTIALTTVGVLTAGAISASVVAAGGHCGYKSGFRGDHGPMSMLSDHKIGHIADKLDLDDAQRNQVFTAIDQVRPEVRDLHREVRETRDAMMELDPRDADYQTKVAALAAKAGDLASRATSKVGEMKGVLYNVLSDEQIGKFDELRRRHRDKHDGHGGWHRS